MTPRGKQRLTIIIIVLLSLTGAAALASYALREDVMYFQSPTDVIARQTQAGQNFRLGGIVAKGSIKKLPDHITRFTVTDMKKEISAEYRGVLPDLFREGQGVIADGALNADGIFIATRVLAKHDEHYKPPEMSSDAR